jgi:DNA-binding transcriptional MerR regulator
MNQQQSMSYGIGSVARMTGLTTHTIRAWEHRHGAIETRRDGAGRRRYTPADVERLTKLKRLVDLGERIGTVARLSPPELDEQLAAAAAHATAGEPPTASLRIAVFGAAAGSLGKAFSGQTADYALVAMQADVAPATIQENVPEADCLVWNLDSVAPDDAVAIERLTHGAAARAVVLVYGFARDAELQRLEKAGVALVRAPASSADLRRAVTAAALTALPGAAVAAAQPATTIRAADAPRFTAAELNRLASISTDIDCECPHHLVSLIRYLRAFERYSADCSNRNAADAAMHEYLYRETLRASQIVENGLRHLIEFEGIDLASREPDVSA